MVHILKVYLSRDNTFNIFIYYVHVHNYNISFSEGNETSYSLHVNETFFCYIDSFPIVQIKIKRIYPRRTLPPVILVICSVGQTHDVTDV